MNQRAQTLEQQQKRTQGHWFFICTNIAGLLKNSYKLYLHSKNDAFNYTLYKTTLYKIVKHKPARSAGIHLVIHKS